MFTKRPDKEPTAFEMPRSPAPSIPSHAGSQQGPAPASPQEGSISEIGADLTIIGNLMSQGEVHIDGEIQGDLHAASVLIGQGARITGGIVANEVIIRGNVMGSVRGNRVVLQSTSHVEGDVFHQQLAIEQGAYFEGKSRRVEDPTAGVQRPEFAPPQSNGHSM
jgi:cytoskeletal protein CcmA (bactofilin family)